MKIITVPGDLNKNPVKYLAQFQQYNDAAGDPRFAGIPRLAIAFYSFRYSNAEVERVFSKMNYFKSELRNIMASPTTEALIRINGCTSWRGEECYNFDIANEMKGKFNAETIYKLSLKMTFCCKITCYRTIRS